MLVKAKWKLEQEKENIIQMFETQKNGQLWFSYLAIQQHPPCYL